MAKTMAFHEQFIISNLYHLTHNRTSFKGSKLGPIPDPSDLERGCPLDNFRHEEHQQDSITTTPGLLEHFPFELVQIILLNLDLQSLTTLRRVNRRLRQTIDSLRDYDEIIQHAPNSLRAVLSIGLSGAISCLQLHAALCSQRCVSCGRFGAFLYLLTCERACYACLIEDLRFLPLTPGDVRWAFGIGARSTGALVTARTLPILFSQRPEIWWGRVAVVDRTAARRAGIQLHGTVERMIEYLFQMRERAMDSNRREARLCSIDFSRDPSLPPYPEVKGGDALRFLCVVRFPWLDRSRDKIEWGLSCTGCHDKVHKRTDGKQDWRWLYTTSGYLEHFKQCNESIMILESVSQETG